MAVSVARLSEDDGEAARRINRLFAEVFGDAESYAAEPPSDAYLAEVLAKPGVIALAAVDGDETVGALVAYEFDKLERARREIYIYDLAVLESRRREGVATALIGRVREIAAERGAWAVYVQADYGDDPAVALYTKLGRREDVMHFDIETARN